MSHSYVYTEAYQGEPVIASEDKSYSRHLLQNIKCIQQLIVIRTVLNLSFIKL